MKAQVLLTFSLLFAIGCSNQYRTTDPQISSETLMSWLGEAVQSSAQSFSGADVSSLINNPGTSIYFADAPGPMGLMTTIFPFDNWNFLGGQTPGAIRVFFLDNPNFNGGRASALIVGVASSSGTEQFQYMTFSGSSYTASGEFVMSFNGNDGQSYTLRSWDLDGDQLAANIQLKMYDANGAYVGKFSILAGFQ